MMSIEENTSRPAQRKEAAFRPGFRLSCFDVIVLAAGGIGALLLLDISEMLSRAVIHVVSTFFVFCNMLRMCRLYELIWAASFVALSASNVAFDVPSQSSLLTIMLVLAEVLGLLQLRHPSYHGIFWRLINPGLPQWWAKQQAEAKG